MSSINYYGKNVGLFQKILWCLSDHLNLNFTAIFYQVHLLYLVVIHAKTLGWLSRSYNIYSNNGLQIMLIWCNLCNLNEHSSLQMSLCQLYGKWFCSKVWGSDKSYNIFWKRACFFKYSFNLDNIYKIYSFKAFKDSNLFYENLLWLEKSR